MRADIVVNGRFSPRATTGVERYASEVIQRLGDRIRLARPPRELRGVAGHAWEQFILPGGLNDHSVLWSPANTGPLSVARQVVTIHDCSPLDHPEWFRSSFAAWYRFLLPRLARRVCRVITDSQFSRQRILETCRLPEHKVLAIPCGVDLEHFHPRSTQEIRRVHAKHALPDKYIIMVASLDPRKNIPTLLRAWEMLIQEVQQISLVIAGGGGLAFREIKIDPVPERVKFLGYVEESDLPALYSGATACINPSSYEGFGLSVLEAMACGSAVIASSNSSLPEVVGDAGLLVDPHDAGAIASAIASILSDHKTRKSLVQKGLERVKTYSWEKTAQGIWNTVIQAQDEI